MYAGIDLHKKYAHVTIMDGKGYIQRSGRFENGENLLVPMLASLKKSVEVEAVVESTYGWYWLGDQLEDSCIPFHLAHPQKVKAIAGKKKTDEGDSQILAHLLRTNLLPVSYIPTKEERAIKELLRFRFRLVNQRSVIKKKLRDILAKQNLVCSFSDITGKGARDWFDKKDFPFPYDTEIESLLRLAEEYDINIKKYEAIIRKRARKSTDAQLLTTIPGVGDILALTLVTEIGDIDRFTSQRSLASYAGIVPSVRSSGGKTHMGPITKRGNPYIRWALAEAVVHTIKKDKLYRDFYQKLSEKKGVKAKAKVATMNKLLRAIYYMLKKQVPYMSEGLSEEKKV